MFTVVNSISYQLVDFYDMMCQLCAGFFVEACPIQFQLSQGILGYQFWQAINALIFFSDFIIDFSEASLDGSPDYA